MRFICSVAFLLLTAFVAAAQEKPQPIVASDLMKIVTVSQLAASPDGRQVVAAVTRKASKTNNATGATEYYYNQHLYLLDPSGKKDPVQLTFGDRRDGQATWSPDGQSLAFVRVDGDAAQVWILPLTGGEAYAITKTKYGASRPLWSPDGKTILFASSIPFHAIEGQVPWTYDRPGRKQGDEPNWKLLKDDEKKNTRSSPDGSLTEVRAWLAKNATDKNPRVLTRLDLQDEQDLEAEEKFVHLFTVPAQAGSETKQLTTGYQNFNGADWSVDGKSIICSSVKLTSAPDYIRTSSLWKLDADGKNLTEFLKVEGQPITNPQYSPDGKSIAFILGTNDGFFGRQNDIGIVAATGGTPTNITKNFDRDVQGFEWSEDNKAVYFNAESEGDIPLYSLPAKGDATPVQLIVGDKGVTGFTVKSGKIIYGLTETSNPWEVYAFTLKDKTQVPITKFNTWVSRKQLIFPKEYWITRPDGMKVQYWVLEPVGRKEGVKYPTILNIHGGPTAMWGPSAFSMWHEFQLEAAWGYGVVFCNPRGSGGYGDAFKRGNFKNWGKDPAADILASLDDAMKQHSWIDKDQLVVEGGSYAGYMVAWLIGHDNRFKAANAQRGVYDLTTFMGEGNAWRLVPDYFGGYPWEPETKKLLDAESPLTYVDKINTPFLIIHGDQDLRTGVVQSEMLYKSLKIQGKPVEYIRYPKEGHELTRSGNPGRMMDHLLRVIEFFERYVRHPEPPAASTSTN
ncbi:S9 family peptidase [Chryseolinea lacunae]|uniref:S9 family peptidase n=1 Tax=Chryseolinea lacunae TaxID=2801331 RepID=A0ABS1KL25_9BACT|nr:S9 family peptidase [Chryseolinea lacunae]MBL0740160.1 S9 family peptidase [Chryseolinea lacunae]